MNFDIKYFDKYKENNRIEVKKASGGLPNSLWDTYSAFANCYGGVIILGVAEREDGSWYATGLLDERKLLKQFWDVIRDKKKVSLNILTDDNVKTYTEESSGNNIIVISVPPAKRSQKPIYINNDLFAGTYRRSFEGDYHCTKDEVLSMLRDQSESTIDMKVLEDMPLTFINKESVEQYRNRHSAYKPGHPWVKLPYEEYLEQLGAADYSLKDGKLHPTAAGLLMFGTELRIVKEFPEYFLDYREMLDSNMRWTDRLISSSGEWSGNLFDFFFTVYNKLIKSIKVPFKLENGIRVDDTPVHKALREALTNCLVNTDYYLPQSIVIKLYPNKIVMENPGSIRTGKKQMLKGGISDPRNKTIMKMFGLINIGERAGSGVPDIYSVWKNEGWDEPIVEEKYNPDRTILTLSFEKTSEEKQAKKNKRRKTSEEKQAKKNKLSSKTIKNMDIIRNYLKNNKEATASEIADLLELSDARTRAILTQMEDIIPVGKTTYRTYKLSK